MNRKKSTNFLPVFLVVYLAMGVFLKASPQKEPVQVPKLKSKIKIDAKLDEPAWQNALKLELKYETEPAENTPAPVKTDVFMFYNQSHVYFALICYDPDPESIRARYSMRDDFDFDDLININLDTFNDERQNYFFGCNPLGVQRDGTETKSGNLTWDAIWDSAGRITDKGYIIEMAIPFSSLQFQRKKGPQIWGLDISRWYQRSFRHRLGLVKMDRNNNSYQSQFMKIIGFEGAKPGKNIEIIPTITGTKTDAREPFPSGDFTSISKDFDPGLTVRWGLTSNLTVNGTINPDFSQVEADARQLDINQPFALYFQEKRPFFTEGSDYFSSPFRVIHTRSMRDPHWGLKLSGKEGKNTVGAYYVRDNLTNLIFPGSQGSNQTSIARDSTALVMRYKRDFGSHYTLGAIVTNREGGDYFNRVYGIDGEARITRKNRIQFQFIGSSTRYPDNIAAHFQQPYKTFSDSALHLNYNYNSRNLNFSAYYIDVGKNFRADLGFMPRVNYSAYGGSTNYQWLKNNGWWSYMSVGAAYDYAKDGDGNFLTEAQEIWYSFSGILQSQFTIEGLRSREAFGGKIFECYSTWAEIFMHPTGNMRMSLSTQFGERIDYANARLGKQLNINGSITYNFGKNLKVNADHTYEKMNVMGNSLYTANVSQGSIMYFFNSRIFIRSILQYVDYQYNTDNYLSEMIPELQELFTQFLFSYRLNPRTVLFLGYTDNHQSYRDIPLTQKNRTFFMKISYSLQI
jgi:hypothetical protein